MGTIIMTAKELKNRTGDAFRAVGRGDRVVLTRRGRPAAVMVPVAAAEGAEDLPPFEAAWADIEATLAATEPEFESLAAAMSATRRRP